MKKNPKIFNIHAKSWDGTSNTTQKSEKVESFVRSELANHGDKGSTITTGFFIMAQTP
ncbi:MAG: hypothetical protein J0M15_05410 [Deltaproteobacteria bacterium]|nr:hypothetical protein [Deltaproteobacteria bacterium]